MRPDGWSRRFPATAAEGRTFHSELIWLRD